LPKIELIDATGGSRTFAPARLGEELGTYRVNFASLPEGRYQARIAGSKPDDASCQAIFDVRDMSDEQLDLRARPDLMQRIADDSGGGVLRDNPATEVASAFKQHLNRTRPVQVEHAPAWDRWWILAGILAIWMGSWALRRASGLV
jgi:hypothetical protein